MSTLESSRYFGVHQATYEPSEVATRVPIIQRMVGTLFSSIDSSSLILLRIGLGAFFAWWAWDYLESGRVTDLYVLPKFHFSYFYFDWIRPWPGHGMVLHFCAIILFSMGVALGAWYRISAFMLATSFTYVFLIDRTNYQNHYYLMTLISWLLVFLPLNETIAVDCQRRPKLIRPEISAWAVWLMRFHVSLPYFFGGIAKINFDWLAGHPMQEMLSARADLPYIGSWLAQAWMVPLSAWGSMLFDLSIVPLLLWKRSRTLAFSGCVAFHLANSVLFNIHVFPWLMILATTVFFEPSWPRRVLGGTVLDKAASDDSTYGTRTQHRLSPKVLCGLVIAIVCVSFHAVWPLRHLLYSGDASWTEQGHHFAWRMMLRGKISATRFYVSDCTTGETYIPSMKPIISQEQFARFSHDPAMIVQLAHYLAERHQIRFGHAAQVHVIALASLNGRRAQFLIDPTANLANIDRNAAASCIVPLHEPLRSKAWNVPIANWERELNISEPRRVTTRDPFGQ